MVWWLFRKKEDDYREKWDSLNKSLKISFENIKDDINKIKDSTNFREKEQNERLTEIETKVDFLASLFEKRRIGEETEEEVIKKEEISKEEITTQQGQSQKLLNLLTDTQKTLLLQSKILEKEWSNSEGWFPMKELAREKYPNTKYEDVKSMISNYTDTLLDLGLIEKKRKGRNILIHLTEKANILLKDFTKKSTTKIKAKKKE